jgi:hypothetical protein
MFGLTPKELAVLTKLNTPAKVQDFLDQLPMNWEKKGETHYSPRNVLRHKKAHCIEGAALAALAFWVHGEKPLLMDLYARGGSGDVDQVVALYKRNGYLGCVSKTNHPTIRFRDPVYKTLRELALSYFHEWFMNTNGEKTLESYSRPLNLKKFGTKWITSQEDLWYLDDALNALPHYKLVPKKNQKFIRRADHMELKAGRLEEWKKSNRRT